jgi:hypothetical protein
LDYITNGLKPRVPLVKPGEAVPFARADAGDRAVVPLTWAATSAQHPYANLGDALSPLVVSALSGLPIAYHRFQSNTERLACVGTIGHKFVGGRVHVWGTGFDPRRHPLERRVGYCLPPQTEFWVHAVRGPLTADLLRQQGLTVPAVYGDPVWFLPTLLPPAPKTYELGVVLHLSELRQRMPESTYKREFKRYRVPPHLAESVQIISPLTEPNVGAIAQRIQAITACKRIVSTSLHGLIIAEAYGIPCAYFSAYGNGGQMVDLTHDDPKLLQMVDRRMRDAYLGFGKQTLWVYGRDRTARSPWRHIIRELDRHWQPLDWSGADFLDAFPLPLAFNPLKPHPDSLNLLEHPIQAMRRIWL